MSKNEPGLEHVQKLHISPFKDGRSVYNEFARKYGQKKAHEIVDGIFEVAKRSQQGLYEKKNENYDVAMLFSGGFDADIVRKSCNWIFDHKDVFGDEILEIGCDCGFITTFLGTIFPDKHITAIDRSKNGIEIAKKNVERFGIKNVSFLCMDVFDLTDIQYNTVFSMRTAQENGDCIEDSYNELVPQAAIFAEEKQAYADKISSLIKNGGNMVSIERMGLDAMFYAWIIALEKNVVLKEYRQLECIEVGEKKYFQAMILDKSDASGVDSYTDFMNCFLENVVSDQPEYYGWDAKIFYELEGGKLIEGYESIDKTTHKKNKVVVRMHKTDDTCIILYNNNAGETYLSYYDISMKDELLDKVKELLEEVKNNSQIDVAELKE